MLISLVCLVQFITLVGNTPGERTAQQSKTIPIYVDHTGRDSVGAALALSVREAIRRSAGYTLAPTYEQSILQVNIVSVTDSDRDIASAIAVSYTVINTIPYQKGNPQTVLPLFLTTEVYWLGRSRVDGYGNEILATVDKQVDLYRRMASQ